MVKWQKMTKWQNAYKLKCWELNGMTWQRDKMWQWRNGKVTRWWNGNSTITSCSLIVLKWNKEIKIMKWWNGEMAIWCKLCNKYKVAKKKNGKIVKNKKKINIDFSWTILLSFSHFVILSFHIWNRPFPEHHSGPSCSKAG